VDPYLYDLAGRLVAADTVSDRSNEPLAELLADELDRLGFRIARQAAEIDGVRMANLVAWLGPPEPDGLILSGHLDVVPFEASPAGPATRYASRPTATASTARTRSMKGFVAQCL
jgi:acetylornithine deacetylase